MDVRSVAGRQRVARRQSADDPHLAPAVGPDGGAIMRDIGTTTASIKMAHRVLNILGEVNAYSLIANTPERIETEESGPARGQHRRHQSQRARGQGAEGRGVGQAA